VSRPHSVHFLGLWDTVAATRLFVLGGNSGLRGGKLESDIHFVRHALATDERRYSFSPEAYEGDPPQYIARWFPGYHCDVGGGDSEERSGLSNVALLWMRDRSSAGVRLLGR
jgi:uncharacterized protein (DUF2235 family)